MQWAAYARTIGRLQAIGDLARGCAQLARGWAEAGLRRGARGFSYAPT